MQQTARTIFKGVFNGVASLVVAGTLLAPAAHAQFAPTIAKQDVENARRQEKAKAPLPLILSQAQTAHTCFSAAALNDAYDKAGWKLIATAYDADKNRLSIRADEDGHWNLVAPAPKSGPPSKQPPLYCVAEEGSHLTVDAAGGGSLRQFNLAAPLNPTAARQPGLREVLSGILDDGRRLHLLAAGDSEWVIVKSPAENTPGQAYVDKTGMNYSPAPKNH